MITPGRADAAAVLGPLGVTLALVPFRDRFANTNAALLLVLVVVAVAAGGHRPAGLLAALTSGLSFDFFLTQPYQRFTIEDRQDIETALLLLAVGVAVTELAAWGYRQQARSTRQAGYLAGIQDAVDATADIELPSTSPQQVIDTVCRQLTRLLDLRRCRFDDGSSTEGSDGSGVGLPGRRPRLRPDGGVEVHGAICDVDHFGLPLEHEIELLPFGENGCRFLLTASPDSRPSLAQRLTAVGLATRASAVLADHRRALP